MGPQNFKNSMTSVEFKTWRRSMNWTQDDAAKALGISKGAIENYERGVRRDTHQAVEIPYAIAFVCRALSLAHSESDIEFLNRIATTSIEHGIPTEGEAERFRSIEAEAFSHQVFENLLSAQT